MVKKSPVGAAIQEVKSIVGSSVILTMIIELYQMLKVNSWPLVFFTILLIAGVNMYWMYLDNGKRVEDLTMESQLSRFGISSAVVVVGIGVIAVAISISGVAEANMAQKLDALSKKSPMVKRVLSFVNTTIIYSFFRTLINFFLGIMAASQ